ncbi:MAG: diguanylate cyclase, partial [Nitrospirota bacterium]
MTKDQGENREVFQEKVYVLANEVLKIIKELHQEHKHLVNSKLIANKMFDKDSIKEILHEHNFKSQEDNSAPDELIKAVNNVLAKFSALVPESVKDQLNGIDSQNLNKLSDPSHRLNSAVKILKEYLHSISGRISELEDLIEKTVRYLSEMESYLTSEINSSKDKFLQDRTHEEGIAASVDEIRKSFNISSDIYTLKNIIFSKLENITEAIEEKKAQDILKLKETERTLSQMSRKISEIVLEAEVIKKRVLAAETESIHDNLTKIYNRKAYDTKIEETLADMNRYNISSSILLCDIDHFKRI